MTPTSITLLLLTSGYLLLRYSPLTEAAIFRSEGHALYFKVAAIALAVAAYTSLLLHELHRLLAPSDWLTAWFARILTFFGVDEALHAQAMVAVTALPVTAFLTFLFQLPVRCCDSLQEQILLSRHAASEIEEFMWINAGRDLPVALTLGSGKVYIGAGVRITRPREDRLWLRLEPFLSGYRDDQQRLHITTSYAWIHRMESTQSGRSIQDFDILIPLDDIKSAHAFDLSAEPGMPRPDNAISPAVDFHGTPLPGPGRTRYTSKAVGFYLAYATLIWALPLGSYVFGTPAAVAIAVAALLSGVASAVDEAR